MDVRCQSCPFICKRLDSDDEPAHYTFPHLTPLECITLLEADLKLWSHWEFLEVEGLAPSAGNQLAASLMVRNVPRLANPDYHPLVLIAQAQSNQGGPTSVCLRYGVDQFYCDRPKFVGEFDEAICAALEGLARIDRICASCNPSKLDC